jgi:type I restriction enzyme S subunit
MSAEWQTVRIGDLGKVVTGKTPSTAVSENFGGNYPFITIPDLDGRREIATSARTLSELGAQAMRSCRLPAGAVMMSCIATIGKCGITTRASFTNQQINSLICKDGVDPKFVYYSFSQLGRALEAAGGGGSVYTNVSKSRFESIEIKIPSLQTQKVIVAILAKLDDKIDLNRRINQTLEAMAQAIFKSWFVDFDPVKANIAAKQEGRDPLRAAMNAISGKPDAEFDTLPPQQYEQLAATATLFPEEIDESELGDIPRGWSVSKVETLLSRLSAKARYTKEQVSAYGQIPVFEQGASILLGYHNGVASYPASAESPMFIFGDHTCVTRLSCQPFDISQNVIPLQGKDRATAWVYYAVKEKQKFQEYRRHWMELISKDVVVATADICIEFSKRISKLHLQIEANERQIQSLRELRDTLLPKLLSDELSVTETIAEAEA